MSFTSSLLRSTPRLASRTAFSSASLASRHASRRFLATTPGQSGQSSSGGSSNAFLYGLLGAGVLGGGAYYVSQRDPTADEDPRKIRDAASPKEVDYQKVYNAVAEVLEQEDYDGELLAILKSSCVFGETDYRFAWNVIDGSYGPVLVRLAWHCSGTYDKESNSGGSNG